VYDEDFNEIFDKANQNYCNLIPLIFDKKQFYIENNLIEIIKKRFRDYIQNSKDFFLPVETFDMASKLAIDPEFSGVKKMSDILFNNPLRPKKPFGDLGVKGNISAVTVDLLKIAQNEIFDVSHLERSIYFWVFLKDFEDEKTIYNLISDPEVKFFILTELENLEGKYKGKLEKINLIKNKIKIFK